MNLSEADARTLSRGIVTEVLGMGGHVETFHVALTHEGFYFVAKINGRTIWARTPQGRFRYRDVARELLGEALKAQDAPWVAEEAHDLASVS